MCPLIRNRSADLTLATQMLHSTSRGRWLKPLVPLLASDTSRRPANGAWERQAWLIESLPVLMIRVKHRNGITNNDIFCVEIPTNMRVGINNWNIGVARWMNTCMTRLYSLCKRMRQN